MAKEIIPPEGYQQCSICGNIKPLDDFPPYYRFWERNHMRMPDCWDCRYLAALSRLGTVKNNTVIAFVRAAVTKALRYGYISKTGICSKCGKLGTHKHHPRYCRPLDVVYLCDDCHREYHKVEKAMIRENGNIPEHYLRKYFTRVGKSGKNYIQRPGAPILEPVPYRTNFHNHWAAQTI